MSHNLNIIDTINEQGAFSVFARLLRTSKAVELLTGPGPFTVFAPTNDAFGNIPDKQMNAWTSQPGQTNLAKVLSHHIVASKLFSSNLTREKPVTTLSGAEVSFSDSNGLKVDESGVLARNIEAGNGIVHALDRVLTLPANAMLATAAAAGLTTGPAVATSDIPPADDFTAAGFGPTDDIPAIRPHGSRPTTLL